MTDRAATVAGTGGLAAMALAAAAILAWGDVQLGLDFEGGAAIDLEGDAPIDEHGLASVRERVAAHAPDPSRVEVWAQEDRSLRVEVPALDDEGAARVGDALAGEPLGIYAPLDANAAAPGPSRWLSGPGGGPRVLVATPAVITGADVAGIEADRDGVTLRLTADGARRFADFTRSQIGVALPVALGDRVLIAPVVRDPIEGGELRIDGAGDVDDLAGRLRAGTLPALRVTSVSVIHSSLDPRLGRPLAVALALAGAALALAYLLARRRAILVAAAVATTVAAVIAWATWHRATFNLQLHVTGVWLALPVAAIALWRGWVPWIALAMAIVAAFPLAYLSVTPSSSAVVVLIHAAALLVPGSSPVALVAAVSCRGARRAWQRRAR